LPGLRRAQYSGAFFSAPQNNNHLKGEIMKTRKYWILVIVPFSILIVLWPAQQITGETNQSAKDKETGSNLTPIQKLALSTKRVVADEKEILQGLEGVRVFVEPIEPEVEKYGLTKKVIQTDTKLQLRQYGIKVLTKEEWLSTTGMPLLYINVNIDIREERPAIRVELQEKVLLLREPKRTYYGAVTWHRNEVVLVGLDRIKDLREVVKDYVSEFINDYLAANPKEIKAQSKKQ
jgi:hypothetical protein